jgi:hypothetical protein
VAEVLLFHHALGLTRRVRALPPLQLHVRVAAFVARLDVQ